MNRNQIMTNVSHVWLVYPHAYKMKPISILRRRLAEFMREKRGDTNLRDFSRKIGLSRASIQRIETEDQNVTLDTLEHLCKVYRCDIAHLFGSEIVPHRAQRVKSDTSLQNIEELKQSGNLSRRITHPFKNL